MKRANTLDTLDEMIRSRSILAHPFYVAWQEGRLSQDQIATYARVYYPHVATFPSHLEAALARATDPLVREELARNLDDELGHPAPHPELWLDFAEALGLARSEVSAAAPHPAAQRMIDTLRRQVVGSSASALAALYAYESQQPEVSQSKIEGLESYYGLSRPEAVAYFAVHATLDREHRNGERAALDRCLEHGAANAEVIEAASECLNAYWQLLDGVCDEAAVNRPGFTETW